MQAENRIPTFTLVSAIGGGLALGIFLSLFIFLPTKGQKDLKNWLSNFGQGTTDEPTGTPDDSPVVIVVPSVHVDPWLGNSLPSITITPITHTTSPVTQTPTTTAVHTPTVTTSTTTHTPTVTHTPTNTATSTPTPTPTQSTSATNYNTKHFNRKVLLIHVDPQVPCPYKGNESMQLHECMDWNDPKVLAPGVAKFFKDNTNSHVNFTIVEEYIQNEFTEWSTGCLSSQYWQQCTAAGNCSRPNRCTSSFKYTAAEYFACVNDPTHDKCFSGETNMKKMMSNYGVPTKVNNGTIDEVWIYGAPWMSMWESQAIGPRAFGINSPPIREYSYNRTTVMMPMSYERDLGTSIHNFGHRFEATMSQVYGSWAENRTNHSWDKFALVKAQSPNYSYSGCGSTHYPPNAEHDYEYGNTTNVVATTCDTFYSYPDLSLYGQTKRNVTCTEWGCTELGYHGWWVKHMPRFKGVGTDSRANDWWYYLLDLDNVFKVGSEVITNQ